MSATGRSDVRIDKDSYPTPTYTVDRFLDDYYPYLPQGYWLDPCAGDGAIIRAVTAWYRKRGLPSPIWHAVEIREECTASLTQVLEETGSPGVKGWITDFLKWTPEHGYNVILTNPPYSLALEFIQASMKLAPIVIMLLRVNFLGSEERAEWFRQCPPDLKVLPNRPIFVSGQGDMTEYAWFVWTAPWVRPAGSIKVLGSTPKSERPTPGTKLPRKPREKKVKPEEPMSTLLTSLSPPIDVAPEALVAQVVQQVDLHDGVD
jgi:hypothetical protein